MESDVESQASISEPSQRFKPREDDDKTLYEVIEITAEKGDRYKVRWKGKDPKTRKPWAQSWVPKTDCTDDLVLTWKRKMKDKARTKGMTLTHFLNFSYTNTFDIQQRKRVAIQQRRSERHALCLLHLPPELLVVPTRQQPIPPPMDTSDADVRFLSQLDLHKTINQFLVNS